MNYDEFFGEALAVLREDGNFRIFADLERRRGAFPNAVSRSGGASRDVTIWCSND